MEMQGSRHLAVSQQQAWDALNDPEVLKACIPGCEKFEPAGENEYLVTNAVKVGPVSARFTGKVALADVLPPNSYTIRFEAQGGPAGFGKGNAQVSLAPPAEGGGCELAYTVQSQVGGKIAQVGQRLIDGVARSMADDFFQRFEGEMRKRFPQAYEAEEPVAAAAAGPADGKPSLPAWTVIAFIAFVVAFVMWLSLRK